MPAHYPTDVPQHLERATADHGDGEADEAPREGRLQDETAQREGEEGEESGIGGERWPVCIVGLFDRAGRQGTGSSVRGQLLIIAPV